MEELLAPSEHVVLSAGQEMLDKELAITGDTSVELGVEDEIDVVTAGTVHNEELEVSGKILVTSVPEVKSVRVSFQL